MISVLKKSACLLCAAAAVFSLTGCRETQDPAAIAATEIITLPTAPTVEETVPETDPRELVEHLEVVLEAGQMYTLEHYPNLRSVDLSGSTCYDAILDYIAKYPEVDVTYTVDLGGTQVSGSVSDATLAAGEFTYEALLENLTYLPRLTQVNLADVDLTAEQISTLTFTYPQITLHYSVQLLDMSCDSSSTELDLTSMGDGQVAEAAQKLALLPNLQQVTLSNALSMENVAKLQDACPNAQFLYSFSLFGQTLSTADTEVIYKKTEIGNDGEPQLRKALAILDNCQRFVLDECGLDYEILAKLREDFREGPKVVWRVRFGVGGRYTTLTDDTIIRCVENVTDSTCGPLKYLEDVVHADLGHNDTLTDASFIQYMTKLETLILSGSAITTLDGFENCKNLLWLELAYCAKITDVTPLAGCDSLKYLNLSYTGVKDYMPLDGLRLERFVCLSPKASKDERATFLSIHPKEECITVFSGQSNPYSYGWRYNDYGKTFFSYYEDVVRVVFELDKADANLAAQKKAAGK